MALDTDIFRARLTELCAGNESCMRSFKSYLEKETWTENDWELVLRCAGQVLLDSNLTLLVGVNLRPWLLELLGRAESAAQKTRKSGGGCGLHHALCVALSKLVTFSSNAERFCLRYFQDAPAPFETEEDYSEPQAKKLKKQGDDVTEKVRLQATLDLLFAVRSLTNIWKCSQLTGYLNSSCEQVRWLACQCLGIISRMSEEQQQKLIIQHVSPETHTKLTVINSASRAVDLPDIWTEEINNSREGSGLKKVRRKAHEASEKACGEAHLSPIEACPSSRHTVFVSGVSIPLFDKKSQDKMGCLVSVGSTNRNLSAVCLGVCEGRPVLIQGPVGSGKTSLVEHIALLTGRRKAPYLTKVQLGDQTDSKTLLGTYICTAKPGEFLWRAGSLTQAVTKGYWLLLEDIDSAPMDVISILVPLLESRTLPVPGHGNVGAHPNFQLFATRRTLSGAKLTSGHSTLLENHWTRVTLETLTRSELLQLVNTRWGKLKPVSDKLVTVYLMLSAGQHLDDIDDGSQEVAVDMTTVRTSGRLVSTRDFMKWCSRVANHIENTETLASRAFQEALDCFCAAVPDPQTYFKFALHIGSYLNRTRAEVDHYCTQYKPEVKHNLSNLMVGKRSSLYIKPASSLGFRAKKSTTFSFTRPSSCLLERIGVAIMNEEPVLIVGETGTGKTSTVQYLAHQTRRKLRVINMNQQSDSADLLGGYKPVQMKTIVLPVRQEFEELFSATFSEAKNYKFLQHVMTCFYGQKWKTLFTLIEKVHKKALVKIAEGNEGRGVKRGNEEEKRENEEKDGKKGKREKEEMKREKEAKGGEVREFGHSKSLVSKWNKLKMKVVNLKEQVEHAQSALAFSFIEGAFIKAIQDGEWVLLDEINLASAETLECLSGLLESNTGSLVLMERGDNMPISRHPDFRLFACMNPATDVGKRELPAGLRNRFTEFYMEELQNRQDIMIIIGDYLAKLGLTVHQVKGIQKFYKRVREAGEQSLCDGTGRKPHYSLRTLCRALTVASTNPCGSVPRSLYESFCLSFLTQLDRQSHPVVVGLVRKYVLDEENVENKKLTLNPIPQPSRGNHIQVEGYWIPEGSNEPRVPENYILTQMVRQNLRDLVRVVSVGRFPVLLQGDTSVGKTSLITYLSTLTGNPCVRINNHEHTDLQEYMGTYAPDETGKLVFREGVLVKAMRQGHWIILDELNLAPTDVLEALNRLLDDNRELFIAETQETVRAHPQFMLFATQNPPGHYGGRKVLSRAFRNRFVELHFTEIPSDQLEIILHHRCHIPLSYSKKMVTVLQDLQNMRRGSNLFQGRQSFITLRDLFRWAERYRLAATQEGKFYDWDQHLADEGYLVLGARVRLEEELEAIKKVLEKRLKRQICKEKLFNLSEETSPVTKQCLKKMSTVDGFEHVVWTEDMRRLYVLVSKALSFREPVLLVGETGCGKTTVCQMIAAQSQQELHTVNCHMHTEGADFLGGLRPVRSREEDDERLFEWVDGPLITSMQAGGLFLADEISLADDSVLERLNSVLEPERMLVLAEKGTDGVVGSSPEIIYAEERFRFIGTMNPGGDYGKKELSPALRNRFTEIWCPKVEINRIASDVIAIIEHNINKNLRFSTEKSDSSSENAESSSEKSEVSSKNAKKASSGIGRAMLEFLEHFTCTDLGNKCTLSIRDLLSWVHFINKVATEPINFDLGLAYIHGACLVLLDGLGSGLTGSGLIGWKELKAASLNFLVHQVTKKNGETPEIATLREGLVGKLEFLNSDTKFGIHPFSINKGESECKSNLFTFKAPRTCINLLRLLRGLQLKRPLLLEGSPGVGKTSLVIALSQAAGHEIVRINLSEQTDVSDLFGSDLPVEGGKGGMFAWHDGPLLQALRSGHWIVLDELNLASQSVLEGLNACFDHRGEIFVPELGRTFKVAHKTTKIFACQNPQYQGGARKGLPKSFLNRFTQIHIEPLSPTDLEFILSMIYPSVPSTVVSKMVKFSQTLSLEVSQGSFGSHGGPWDFNLRDLFRWCEIMIKNKRYKSLDFPDKCLDTDSDCLNKHSDCPSKHSDYSHKCLDKCSDIHNSFNPGDFVGLIYSDRMRTLEDKSRVYDVYERVFGNRYPCYRSIGRFQITPMNIQIGKAVLEKQKDGDFSEVDSSGDLYLIDRQLPVLESLINCINMNWMALLIGESSIGKTSIVKLLAQLSGRKLRTLTVSSDMDVTELLGGFQQVDYGRDLGEAVEEARITSYGAVREALLSGNRIHADAILQAWDKLMIVRDNKSPRTTSEEIAHFQTQCDLLLAILALQSPNQLQRQSPRIQVASQSTSTIKKKNGKRKAVEMIGETNEKNKEKRKIEGNRNNTERLNEGEIDDDPMNSVNENRCGKLKKIRKKKEGKEKGKCKDIEMNEDVNDPMSSVNEKRSTTSTKMNELNENRTTKSTKMNKNRSGKSTEMNELNENKSDKLIERVIKLKELVKEAGGVSGGGTFQWLDSLLIKSIQEGSWLLVDGVNICSASVLDRLNAMLEPGGSLTLSERGVVGGKVPSIVPHTDFRLFLTMNQVHGEISRAMRNRGIEICMVGSWLGNNGVRSMLLQNGLVSPPLQNALVAAHEAVSACIPVYEKPGICQIKQVASLTCQLIETGHSPSNALHNALQLVYARSQCKPAIKDAVQSAINKEFNKFNKYINSHIPWPQFERQAVSIKCLRLGANVSEVILREWLLSTLIKALVYPDARDAWGSSSLALSLPPVSEIGLLNCINLVLSTSKRENWSLLEAWVQQQTAILDDADSHDVRKMREKVLSAIDCVLQSKQCVATNILDSTLASNLNSSETLSSTVDSNLNFTKILDSAHASNPNSFYFDPRFNLAVLLGFGEGIEKRRIEVESLSNKCSLWLWNTLNRWYRGECHPEIGKIGKNRKIGKEMSLYSISDALSKGLISKGSSPHPSISYIVPLLTQIDQLLNSLSNDTELSFSNAEFTELLTALRWCDKFYELTQKKVSKSEFHLFLPELTLYWNWLYEEFLQKFPESWGTLVPKKLSEVVGKLKGVLEKEYGEMHKLASDLRPLVSPAPFTSASCADAQFRLLNIITNLTPSLDNERVNKFLASPLGRDIREMVINLALEVNNTEMIDKVHSKISMVEGEVRKRCSEESEEEMKEINENRDKCTKEMNEMIENKDKYSKEITEKKKNAKGMRENKEKNSKKMKDKKKNSSEMIEMKENVPDENIEMKEKGADKDIEIMEMDTFIELDEDSESSTDLIELKVQLWPLKDYLGILALSRNLNRNLMLSDRNFGINRDLDNSSDGNLNMTNGSLNRNLAFSDKNLNYRNLGNINMTDAILEAPGIFRELASALSGPSFQNQSVLSTHTYLAFTQATSSRFIEYFLSYDKSGSREEKALMREKRDFSILHPATCQLSYIILSGRKKHTKPEDLMEEIQTGYHVEKLGQLNSIRSILWTNWCILSDPSTSYEAQFTSKASQYISSSIGALAKTLGIKTLEVTDRRSDLNDLTNNDLEISKDEQSLNGPSLNDTASKSENFKQNYHSLNNLNTISNLALQISKHSEIGSLKHYEEKLHNLSDIIMKLYNSWDNSLDFRDVSMDYRNNSRDASNSRNNSSDSTDNFRDTNLNNRSFSAAQALIITGVIEAQILGCLEPVDPAYRTNLLLRFHKQELSDLDSRVNLTQWFESLRGSIEAPESSHLHPHLPYFSTRIESLNSTIASLSQHVAYRRGEHIYQQLKNDLSHFLSTAFIPDSIFELLKCAENVKAHETGHKGHENVEGKRGCKVHKKGQGHKGHEAFVMKVNVLLGSCDNFVRKVIAQYPLYRDLTYPFLEAVTLTCEALRLMVAHVHLESFKHSSEKSKYYENYSENSLTNSLESYCSFPSLRSPQNPLFLLKKHLDFESVLNNLLPEERYPGMVKVANNLSLQAALLDFLNICLVQHTLNRENIEMATGLLDRIADIWRIQEEEKAQRALEEESLYRYKPRTITSKTDEEIEEEDFCNAFPSYEAEFQDLEGLTLDNQSKKSSKQPEEETTLGYITDGQLYEVSELHYKLFTNLVQTRWLNSSIKSHSPTQIPSQSRSQIHTQIVRAALLRLQVLQLLVGNIGTFAGSSLDRAVIGALLLGNSQACSLLTEPPIPALISHPYDIYKDPNPQEVIKVRPLLLTVQKRVNELLQKWPGHPTLSMVNTVIDRVLSFPLTSPLMRFVVGLETVLEKAQEWEQNAHSGVSLLTELELITHQVLEWRKMELKAWRSCLDTVSHKVATQGRRWWPHLHSTFKAALTNQVCISEVLKTLKQFLETSTMGDFETRLNLLYSFHCQTALLQTKSAKSILALSWNLYQYYKQFLPIIKASISKARDPIEKEVKDYVKIARWNDINYFAVRESVNKSHRTLHRHMRALEKKLCQPVSPILCDTNTELTRDPVGAWDQEKSENGVGVTLTLIIPPAPQALEHESIATKTSILFRLPFLTQRCHKLTLRTLKTLPYSSYINSVEDLTSDIITSYRELQFAEGRAENLEKVERLKELRHVMKRRRDSLSRLFRLLASLGVMYTRGNSLWRTGDIDSCLSIPPIELEVLLSQEVLHSQSQSQSLSQLHSQVTRIALKPTIQTWPDCVKYLNRCIGRHTRLLASLHQPHKDLGPELIKQLRGIACHLFTLSRDQRKALVRVSETSSDLRCIVGDLREYIGPAPVYSRVIEGFSRLHAFSTSLSLTIAETRALLDCFPRTYKESLLERSTENLETSLEREQVNELKMILDESLTIISLQTHKLSQTIVHFKTPLVTPGKLNLYQEALSQLASQTEKLKKSICMYKSHPSLSQLSNWITEWEGSKGEITLLATPNPTEETEGEITCLETPGCEETENSLKYLEIFITQVLYSVESIYKRHYVQNSKNTSANTNTSSENTNEISENEKISSENINESSDSEKNMLTEGLTQNLIWDEKDLKISETMNLLNKLINLAEVQPILMGELKACVPILEQYLAICETVLASLVTSGRSVSKLTSVLLAIFQVLASKGFCRPQELDEEEGEAGEANTFEESSGTGLGEGEGQKDVSDRFESEDQLESALQEGETEKPGDEDLHEEDKGVEMSEDFEGKQQDVEKGEKNEDSDSGDEEDQDFDKQMGETGEGAEKLDEKLWGDDAEKEEDEKEENEVNEEDGPGDGEVSESKMVAKDENKSKREKDKEQKQKDKLEEMDDTREENKLDEEGEEFNDNFRDPYGGEAGMNEEDEEKFELPEDMNLDNNEENEKEESDVEENPMEIEDMGVFPEEEREPKEKDAKDGEEEEGEEGKQDDKKEKEAKEKEENGGEENEENDKEEEEEGGEGEKKDERVQGTEEKNDQIEAEDDEREKADASRDKNSKTEAEAAEMDTTEGSKDKTKELPKTEAGGQEEEEEDSQEEQGQIGEQTENQDGTGQSESRTREDAHKGESSALVTESSACDQNDMKKPRKPGETDENRTLGDQNKRIEQGLMTKDQRKKNTTPQAELSKSDDAKEARYEHIDKAEDHMDAQMVDAGTQEQAMEAPAPASENQEGAEAEDEMQEVPMEVDEEEEGEEASGQKEPVKQESESKQERSEGIHDPQADGETHLDTEGEVVLEHLVERPPETNFHTLVPEDAIEAAVFDEDTMKIQREIEVASMQDDAGIWAEQEARVTPIALNLCEQLRLILEPTQAARLRGDFRTGKRLNMRKVIPYIASQFRKDKIWLRRMQPSKRTYQILVAVDDSESMCEARAGSLALESVALVTRALNLLEVGQLGVVSFGSSTKILHPLDQPFSEAAGTQILANLKFDQKVTNFSRMLEDSVAILNNSRCSSSHGNPDTAQLLIILSDGQTQTRSEAVKAAVRTARASKIFIVFLVLDAKDNKYSFYDVLVYEEGRMRPLVESFPFPFFLVVRDIETLPNALATALRQWFELVTADAAH